MSRGLEKLAAILELDLEDCSSPRHPFHIATADSARLEGVSKWLGYEEVAKAISQRRDLMNRLGIKGSLKQCLHSIDLTIDVPQGISEGYYQLASSVGLNILHPYFDSRMIKTVLSFREDYRFPYWRVKMVIKNALKPYFPKKFIFRKKSGWGLPVFEWMVPKGVLYPLFKDLENSSLAVHDPILLKKPNFFGWDLLNYNVWYKQFFGRYP